MRRAFPCLREYVLVRICSSPALAKRLFEEVPNTSRMLLVRSVTLVA